VTIAANLAKDFSAAGKFADTLHYNQTGYNELGAAVATAGLAFVGSPSIVADVSPMADVLANMPAIATWKRIYIDTAKSGSWNVQFYSDPTMPFAVTWYDCSGENSASADQSTTFTFADSSDKRVVGYVSNTIGASGSLVGGSTMAATAIAFPDAGIKLNTFNMGTTGSMAANCSVSETSILALDASTIRLFATAAITNRVEMTQAALVNLALCTNVTLARTDPAYATYTNVAVLTSATTFNHNAAGLSVAKVNEILTQFDAKPQNSGSINVSQFLASTWPASTPTGAGATAKTNMQGRGVTVTTD